MAGREILCKYCGMKGLIDVPGLNENITRNLMFRYLGHDPFSGNMHFQCPACREVLAVNPWSVLDGHIRAIEKPPSICLKTKKYGRALFLLMVIFFKYVIDQKEEYDGFREKLLTYGSPSRES
ncbi:MAG: hypothetical protein JW902_14655 [Syntrophaceae bacterium]|nr:hypothetical protein [Syntrophaceae bacterium]